MGKVLVFVSGNPASRPFYPLMPVPPAASHGTSPCLGLLPEERGRFRIRSWTDWSCEPGPKEWLGLWGESGGHITPPPAPPCGAEP